MVALLVRNFCDKEDREAVIHITRHGDALHIQTLAQVSTAPEQGHSYRPLTSCVYLGEKAGGQIVNVLQHVLRRGAVMGVVRGHHANKSA
jgi:hypothetical protein